MTGETPGGSGPAGPDEPQAVLTLKPLERKVLLAGALVLGGIALAGRYGMLPGAAAGAAIAYGNLVLVRRILSRAFPEGGAVRKAPFAQYALKFLALAALVYLVVRSGRFDMLGFLLGLSSLFLGVLLEGTIRGAGGR